MDKDKNNNTKHRRHRHHHRHHRKFWRWFWFVIGIVIVAGALFAGYVYKNLRDTTDNMYTPVSKNTKSNKGRSLDKLLAAKKPINILLLGTDTGAMDRHWKGRTDTIMMLSINPTTKTTKVVSIPRDMEAVLPDYPDVSPIKINSAYNLGGVSETIKTLDKYYSVPIDGYILINMGGLEKAINQVGGVTVTSPLTFSNMGYNFVKGQTYHMMGKEALAFAQLRHGDPRYDYGRQDRDRRIVVGLLKKSISVKTLLNKDFLSSISNEMQTDLTMTQLYHIGADYRQATVNQQTDHAQGESRMISNQKYGQMEVEFVPKKERQRVSNEIRQALELNKVNVTNDGE
ncbi:LCP family protein required for cell wall assembly [Lactobacillus colini]|uniref:LCP family protein required for cell wall assembly n=1 Tax=Lactobacillus colini TaxID=1819254 RepID=A0ABS4MFG1_9LACO|nr:LCP family protein [Lactobacillus colini]MBP2058114.1 LCP family protein required for cell wall assembly [Lactobacillus colini]